ncbi:acetyltransferase [Vibrio rumoiensis]|uniref:Acetyltransferase n=1 Tax=Vibrio rumoiensis 1S-45 TaxID=1188252 RepID=A0A1E5E2Z5_9VIBR|nr:acetyltransferase [Vibrio rumoiensis]OEF25936.1 acetyltransferase [Vibrio rumoiensis 1S-45]
MINSLIIVGASGFGKEVAWLAKRLKLNILGFLDDDENLSGSTLYGYPVLGCISDWHHYEDHVFSVAIASPRIRKKIITQMMASGNPNFHTLIDPSVQVEGEVNNIGSGTIICAGTICTADINIGHFSIINKQVSVGHDVNIGDFCTIAPQVMLGGHSIIGDGSEIGASTSIRQASVVGSGASIGMGSVVVKNIDANSLYFGSPATKVKSLTVF